MPPPARVPGHPPREWIVSGWAKLRGTPFQERLAWLAAPKPGTPALQLLLLNFGCPGLAWHSRKPHISGAKPATLPLLGNDKPQRPSVGLADSHVNPCGEELFDGQLPLLISLRLSGFLVNQREEQSLSGASRPPRQKGIFGFRIFSFPVGVWRSRGS